ncbi:MAG: MvaI/BcnI family restriction endonuclease, partial [Planctomycetota bacterium]
REYRFGRQVAFGIATEFQLLLNAIRDGKVYLDPASKMTVADDGRLVVKSRWQFRIKFKDIPSLYEGWKTLALE